MKIKSRPFQGIISVLLIAAFVSMSGTLILKCSRQIETAGKNENAGWGISSPEEQGIDAGLLVDMLEKIKEENLKIRSVIIIRNGKLVLEAYIHPYNRNTAHDVKSVSKSLISALTGIAVEKKILQNIDQKVAAILAGIGICHLPLERINRHLDNGELIKLGLDENPVHENFLAWKISNKGKGLKALTKRLSAAFE